MRFVDSCRIRVSAGDGGNGVVAFRREKFMPLGGPSGGDGGRGGDVSFVADEGLSSLQDVVYQRSITADRGEHGQGSDCYGRAGEDKLVRVPIGTQIFDDASNELITDLTDHGQTFVIARGGRGGRGNMHFATPFDRAPRRAEKGEPGEVREVRLELKVMADVGLLGFPNVGKSTFVSSVSKARPRIADYPFTTLTPSLGVVDVFGGQRMGGRQFVIADIPGLVPGASEGIGLGIQFLKHVERTRVLLHLVTLDFGEGRDPLDDYDAIRAELTQFSPELATRPEIVALSKCDLPEVMDTFEALSKRFEDRGIVLHKVSAATTLGLEELIVDLYRVSAGQTLPRTVPPSPKPAPKKKPVAKAKPAPKKKPVAKAKPAPKKKPVAKTKSTAKKKPLAKAKPTTKKKPVAKAKPTTKKKPVAKAKPTTKKKPVAKAKLTKAKKPIAKAKKPAARKGKPTRR